MRQIFAALAALFAATTAHAQSSGDLADRVKALEARVEALERALNGAPAPTPPDGAFWAAEIVEAPAGLRGEPGARIGALDGSRDQITLGDASQAVDAPVDGLMIIRRGEFTAPEAGYYWLGVSIGYPPPRRARQLGGFVCDAALFVDGREAFRRALRMPYSRRDRVEIVTSTERLKPTTYQVEQRFACRPDGRHNADAEPALRQIELRSMVKRPSERDPQPAQAGDFAASS